MNKEKYLHKVIKYLSCSKKDKKRIYEDLSANIDEALENGESWQEIEMRFGDPKDLADELMENLEVDTKGRHKKLWIGLICGVCIVVAIGFLAYKMFIPTTILLKDSTYFNYDEVHDKAMEVIEYASNDDYEAIANIGIDEFKQDSVKEQMKETMTMMKHGAFLKISSEQYVENSTLTSKYAAASITVMYEDNAITYTLAFDENLNLSAFYMK